MLRRGERLFDATARLLGNMSTTILVDWGTTSFRAYLVDTASGALLESRSSKAGIMQVKPDAAVLEHQLSGWLPAGGSTAAAAAAAPRVVVCGMAGSRQGLLEVPYVEAPASAAVLARGCGELTLANGIRVSIIPGVMMPSGAAHEPADVMRGEETQLVGLNGGDDDADALPNAAASPVTTSSSSSSTSIVVMPGTHSKWALLKDGALTRFWTMMTGEAYALFREHSILGKLMGEEGTGAGTAVEGQGHGAPSEAFRRGVTTARDSTAGLLHLLFSTRTVGLFHELQNAELPDYLSGILIGCEVRDALKLPGVGDPTSTSNGGGPPTVTLLGGAALCGKYALALETFGFATRVAGDTALAGLIAVAKALTAAEDGRGGGGGEGGGGGMGGGESKSSASGCGAGGGGGYQDTVLVTGGSGTVGVAIQQLVNGNPALKGERRWVFAGSKDGDLTNFASTQKLFDTYKPTHVIHLAAYIKGRMEMAKHKGDILR